MKIAAYDITSTSSRVYTSATHVTTTAKLTTQSEPKKAAEPEQKDEATISDQARQALEQSKQKLAEFTPGRALSAIALKYDGWSKPRDPDELKLNILLRFIEQITGKKFNFHTPDLSMQQNAPTLELQAQGSPQPLRARQLTIEQTSMFHEYEAVSYNSSGVVKTADGQTIAFDVSLNMSREYAEYSSVSMTATRNINVCDPLVINYAGSAGSLTQDKFSFDLLADGIQRNISFAGQGSGFLALDKNGDGTINDGSELFGPQSGNGFGELRAHDSDGNGWIDENDDVYSKLTIWAKDEQGNDIFLTLKEADVGAIYLGDVQTQFTVGNSAAADGFVRSTSIFLKDSGGAGTIQHVDLTI